MARYAFCSLAAAAAFMVRGPLIALAPNDGGGSAPMTYDTLHAQIAAILVEGLTPDAVADAICAAVGLEKPAPTEPEVPLADDDPAVTGVPRDETHDSIDVATGTLTDGAVAARQKLSEDQARLATDEAAVEADKTAIAEDEAALGEGSETGAEAEPSLFDAASGDAVAEGA